MKITKALVMAGTFMVAAMTPTDIVLAQDGTAELDALIDATGDPQAALATARSQAAQGDLISAAATLEGTLLASGKGELDDVRLFYVAVLCRLDDRRRAEIELGKVSPEAYAAGSAEVQAACGTITPPSATGARRDSLAIELAAGIIYNSDAFGVTATQFDIPGFSLSDDGLAFVGSAALSGRAAIGDTSHAYYGVSGLTTNGFSGPALDYQFGTARIGFGNQGERAGVSFGGVSRHGRIGGSSFLWEYGAQGEFGYVLSPKGRLALRGEFVWQDYDGDLPFFTRSGERYDIALEYQGRSSEGFSYVAGIAYELKDAATVNLGYRGVRGYVAGRAKIADNGTYVDAMATLRHVDYRDDTVFLFPDRVETRYFVRGALGLPVGSGFTAEVAGSYNRRDYNALSLLRDYENFGAELRLIYNFSN